MLDSIIDGYKIVEYRGKGTFGTVYKCIKEAQEYAIKIFSLEYVFSEFSKNKDHNRVTQEIDALKRLSHENIVNIIHHGTFTELAHEYVYLIMEYLDGINLKELIEADQKIELNYALGLTDQILSGLEHIHSNDIIHRDLKPENIFLTKDGVVKIVDFGLSKLIDFSSITTTGDQIGSPLYMSPEQIRDSKNIDYRSDYYAVGIILFELLSKNHPYGDITSREQLYYKIIFEKPISILQYEPLIPNSIDNLINHLLEKNNYSRPNSILKIQEQLRPLSQPVNLAQPEFQPTFFLRLYNEKTVLTSFFQDGYSIDFAVFPVNHQSRQSGLLKLITDSNSNFIIDPATMRLAYDTYSDVKGLTSLPYAPSTYNRLELVDLENLDQKRTYVSLVIEEQLKFNPTAILSPFHISNNSNLVSIKNDSVENWFTTDIKLLKESRDYLSSKQIQKPLMGGFCIKSDILTSKQEQDYFLNVLSGLPCDSYLIYVDGIDYTSNPNQLFHYVKTLLTLQNVTGKPVIAGRINSFGLLLLSFGIYGFESGTARFESFYEGLYSEKSDPFNMFVMYYIPELLKNISVKRKDPSKIIYPRIRFQIIV